MRLTTGNSLVRRDFGRVTFPPVTDIQSLIEDFTNQLAAILEGNAMERARQAVESAFAVKRLGRPAKVSPLAVASKPRKKPPRQLCPVPGCVNTAAPVFSMLCAKHKDLPVAKVKKYREARKAEKLGIKPARTTRRAKAVKPAK